MKMRESTLVLLLGSGAGLLQAQDVKTSAIINVWYTQMLDNNLRYNQEPASPFKYYPRSDAARENGFVLRRAEIYFSGKLSDSVSWNAMIDPSVNTSATNPTILMDAYVTWRMTGALSLKVGQFKPLQTYETINQGSGDILFYDRAMLVRQFGDKRDRGAALTYDFGARGRLGAKLSVAAFNGNSDATGGKTADADTQKDWVTRLEFTWGDSQWFGFYTRHGSTDASSGSPLRAQAFQGDGAPAAQQVLDNRDRFSNLGAYYAFRNASWFASAEGITGLLGRRFPSVTTAATPGNASRQHLDQKFLGYVLTGAYTRGRHTFLLRRDYLDYNHGDRWYGGANPYRANGVDLTPRFTETVAGYNYAFFPDRYQKANIKLDYILRSKNFLLPRNGQTSEQGGDSAVVTFQVAF